MKWIDLIQAIAYLWKINGNYDISIEKKHLEIEVEGNIILFGVPF